MFARASSVYSKGFNTIFEEMQSTGLGYKPVERSSEYELAEVGDEQTGSSPLPTQKLSNNPAKPSAQAPQRLSRVQLLPLSIQILLTIFPVLFIGICPTGDCISVCSLTMNPAAALAATAVSLDKKPTSRTGRAVQQAISLSPTIFPVIFAAVIGKFFRALGLFGAERGIKLGV